MKYSFDQYQRFYPVVKILKYLEGQKNKKIKVLDIGGYPGIIKDLLPRFIEYYFSDILKPNNKKNFIPFDEKQYKVLAEDNSFDIVISIDTLEHIPPNKRDMFLEETKRIAKDAIIIVTPIYSQEIEKIEKFLANIYYRRGINHRFLLEHINYKLPKESVIYENFKGYKISELSINGFSTWLNYMLLLYQAEAGIIDSSSFEKINDFLIENYEKIESFDKPLYRRVFFISKHSKLNLNKILKLTYRKQSEVKNLLNVFLIESIDKYLSQKELKITVPLIGFSNLKSEYTTGKIIPPNYVKYKFSVLFENLCGISFQVGTFGKKNLKGSLVLSLHYKDNIIEQKTINLKSVEDNSFITWYFTPITFSKNKQFTLIIRVEDVENDSICLWVNEEKISNHCLYINEEPQNFIPVFKMYFSPLEEGEKIYLDLQNTLSDLKEKNKKLEKEKKDLKISIEEINNKLLLASQTIENQQKIIKNLDREKYKLQNSLNELEKNYAVVTRNLEEQNKIIENIQKENNLLKQELSHTSNELLLASQTIENQKKMIENLDKEKNILINSSKEIEKKYTILLQKTEEQNNLIEHIKKENISLKEKLEENEKYIMKLKNNLINVKNFYIRVLKRMIEVSNTKDKELNRLLNQIKNKLN